MKRFTVFIVLLLSTLTVFSQQNTFIKTFPNARNFNAIIESGDGNFLISCQDSTNKFSLIKIDTLGNLIWQKRYSLNQAIPRNVNIVKDSSNNFFVVGSVYDSLIILKLGTNGEIIKSSKKKMPYYPSQTLNYVGNPKIYVLNDNTLLVAYSRADENNRQRLIITRLDRDLNTIWEKMVDGWKRGISDVAIVGNKIIVLLDQNFQILNMNGDIEIIKTFLIQIYKVHHVDENSFFLFSDSRLSRFDINGNIIFEKDGPFKNDQITVIKNKKNSEYWIYSYGPVLIYNWTNNSTPTRGLKNWLPNSGIQTSDGGFFYCFFDRLTKLDENENLILPAELSIYDFHGSYTVNTAARISWKSNGLTGNARIEVSYDNGYNWRLLTEEVDISGGGFDWLIPDILASKCLIRISSIDFPTFTAMQLNPFKIVSQKENYNATDISINEIKMIYYTDGIGSSNGSNPGFFWPGGESATLSAIYADGLIWAGTVNGELRANGSLYKSGLQPGNILSSNNDASKDYELFKPWKFRNDFQQLPFGSIKNKYIYDFLYWPTTIGAPWIDKNNNGIYEPESGDSPKITGDELHWMIMNDLDTAKSLKVFGVKPIGLEIQLSIFGFKDNPQLKDVLFKKYLLINKGNQTVSNMYFSYFSDNDIGGGSSDFVGCDTTLNLGFSWTSTNYNVQYGFNPPSIGHMILQGPIVKGNPTDRALLNGIIRNGYKNLGMTTFAANFKNYTILPSDPSLNQGLYQGTIEVFNLLRGFRNDGAPFINPLTNQPSHFHFSGDPESETGWIEGESYPQVTPSYIGAADRRYYITSGPFDFAPRDTQEIVIAVLIARGTSNRNSVTELKNLARQVARLYHTDVFNENLNEDISLRISNKVYQNYPNPFNNDTNISFELTKPAHVTLKVYDILGREIVTLLDENKNAGRYNTRFDLSVLPQIHLSSGVYFYRFTTDETYEVKKMIYLK